MASFDPIIRMNENAFRAPEKMQPKVRRKPLGDVTNSSKPPVKDKSNAKTFNGFKVPEKLQRPKAGRKPLGDLTNSNKPRATEKSTKKSFSAKLSAVDEEKGHHWVSEEGFLHNHDECIKAQRQSMTMSMDYFLETVGLKKDSSALLSTPRIPQVSIPSESELEMSMELAELEIDMLDICSPPTPPTPKAPGSPGCNIDWKTIEFSPLKFKDSPVRN